MGWAWDLKVVSPEVVASRAKRTGDGSRKLKTMEGRRMRMVQLRVGLMGGETKISRRKTF